MIADSQEMASEKRIARHYFMPSLHYRDRVIRTLNKLKTEIEKYERVEVQDQRYMTSEQT